MVCKLLAAFASVLVFAGMSPAQFQGYVATRVPASGPEAMISGSFNGDAFPDIVYVDREEGGDVWLVPFLAAGRPGTPVRVGAQVATTAWIDAADMDGDGDADLVMGGVRAPAPPVTIPIPPFPLPPLPPAPFDRIAVGLNDGTGSFTWTYHQLPFYGTGSDGKVGKADGDTDRDLFLLTDSGIAVLMNDGAGNLTYMATYPKTDPSLFPTTNPGAIVADVTSRMDVADFDGDGIDDVAVINNRIRVVDFTQVPFLTEYPVNRVTIHLNGGAGALSIGSQVVTGPNATRIVAGQLDGSGAADFAVVLPGAQPGQGPAPSQGGLEVYRNMGAGVFAGTFHLSNFTPGELIAADFNGDAAVDLATIGLNQYITIPPTGLLVELTVHANQGAGVFASGVSWGLVTATMFPQAGDFDGDGAVDLVAMWHANGFTDIRSMNSMPRSFALRPGTGDDLVLATGVNGAAPTGTPPADLKVVAPGDTVMALLTTPNLTFVGIPLYVFVGVGMFDWANNPVPGSLQILNFPIYSLTQLAPIPPSGSATWSGVAPNLPGFTYMIQFGVLSTAAINGAYATTDAHVIRVL